LDGARAALVNASALAARGDRDQASAQAQAAQSVFESCGAGPFARQAASLRRRIAARGSRGRPARDNPAGPPVRSGPTRREQQVASLVSQGLTNRRIAQRLHVTDKTIEMHLSNIFAKLGVSSRTETAAAVIRGGLAARGPPGRRPASGGCGPRGRPPGSPRAVRANPRVDALPPVVEP